MAAARASVSEMAVELEVAQVEVAEELGVEVVGVEEWYLSQRQTA